MTFAQSLAEQIEYDRVRDEFSAPLQQAGMRVGVVDHLILNADSPNDLRRRLITQLQRTLPKEIPLSVRAELPSQAPADWIASTGSKVKAAIENQAHRSPVLRGVITRDRTGREITEFYGEKKSWMRQFEAPAQIMRRLGAVDYKV